MFFKILQNSQGKSCVRNYFLKESVTQVFSCEFCKISENIFFTEHLQTSFITPKAKVQSFYDLIRLVSCCFASFMALKAKNEKFLWLYKTFVSFYFALFMTLKIKTGSFYALIKHLLLVLLLYSWLKKLKLQVSMT